jgi:hypothetical protein
MNPGAFLDGCAAAAERVQRAKPLSRRKATFYPSAWYQPDYCTLFSSRRTLMVNSVLNLCPHERKPGEQGQAQQNLTFCLVKR